ncbi:hypothetical protein KC19_1G238100 [Ceratodon purpureus]|uniref:Protein phosphatase n=1 Tax=Ceratodon purpureus TaxID=3225 RepID=A0A8T0JBQ3_CERPU|nr:hypothetical protein KC19_1G238100 [Ceratodon purpureus]
MAFMYKYWKLKASFRSPAGYMGGLSQIGQTKPMFDRETLRGLCTKPSITESANTLGGCSPLRDPFIFSFSEFLSSRRTPAANHIPSRVYLNKPQALSCSGTFFRLLFIPSMLVRFTSLQGIRELNGRSLWWTRSYLLTGQLSGVSSKNARRKALKLVVNAISSRSLNEWKEQSSFNRSTTMDIDGVSHVDSHTLATEGTHRSCLEIKDFELEDNEVANFAPFLDIFVGKGTMTFLSRFPSLLNFRNADFVPWSDMAMLKSTYSKYTSNVRFPGRGPSDMRLAGKGPAVRRFCGYHEPHCAKDLSRNLDNEGVQHRNLRLLSGACCLPHPKKVETGGEDAYFICSEEQVVGVADGVGGWADVGVDAGDYARELMLQSRVAVGQEPHGDIDPARVMIRAHARTKCRGSSTACILALSNNGLLAANLGDSGFMLLRNGRAIFKSPVQQHQFNFPFQLESGGSDSPSAAEVFSLQVAAGDVVVAGTDGLFDNLFDNELMGVVVHSTRAGSDPQTTAQNIVALARERAEDRNRQTPFSTAAQEAGFRFYGGKIDDITVIVSYITTRSS